MGILFCSVSPEIVKILFQFHQAAETEMLFKAKTNQAAMLGFLTWCGGPCWASGGEVTCSILHVLYMDI